MKIVFATPLYPPEIGGPATYAELFDREMSKRGHLVKIVKYGDYKNLLSGIRHLAILIRIIKEARKADIIFAQDVFSVGLPATVASKILNKPLMIRVPGDYAWEFGTQNKGVKDNIDEFQKKRYSRLIEFYRRIEKYIVENARIVVTPSEYFKILVKKWLRKNQGKVVTIYNGIDEEKIREFTKKSYETKDKKKIISAGRMVKWKGFASLVKVVSKHNDWNLELVGNGPEEMNLVNLIGTLGVNDRIKLTNSLSKEELWQKISESDIFVLNSTFESFSYQAVEAMSLGIPLVSTNACNMGEIINNGENGIMIGSGNESELENALEKLFSNQELREKIGKKSIEVSRIFSVKNTIDKVEDEIKNIEI